MKGVNPMKNAIVQFVQQQEWALTENMLDIINQVLCERYAGRVDPEKLEQFDNKFEPSLVSVPMSGG
jgi:Txe/YoeB family toxin of Txe-Axe toxin-antitoxin module